MKIEYRNIPNFPGYRVGSDGTIWSCLRPGKKSKKILQSSWKKLKIHIETRTGYSFIALSKDNKKFTFRIHRLVLEAFIGPRPKGMECCHKDDDPANNNLSNLRWDTHKRNGRDAVRNGKIFIGEDHTQAKITEEIALEILKRKNSGENTRKVAEHFGLSMGHTNSIYKGTYWKHLKSEHVYSGKTGGKLNEDQVLEIKQKRKSGESFNSIAKQLKISPGHVRDIIKGKYWKEIVLEEQE